MSDRYEPQSNFLRSVAGGDVPLAGDAFADANLDRLLEATRDEDRSNRDWATFFLAQSDVDTEDVRHALLRAAGDDDEDVRAEAVSGLAQRNAALALPFVQDALRSRTISTPILEAAALVAHASLVERLRYWLGQPDLGHLQQSASDALTACEGEDPQ